MSVRFFKKIIKPGYQALIPRHLKVAFLFWFVAMSNSNVAQSQETHPKLSDSMRRVILKNKKIPDSVIEPFSQALTYFPELYNTSIEVKFKRIGTTMNARPTVGSLIFRRKKNYRFIVRINNTEKDSVIHYNDIPDSAKVGVFGHEFCHFIDYLDTRPFHILGRGAAYLSRKKKAQFERAIDLATIKRGLGRELYVWSVFLHQDSNASVSYKKFKEYTYMTPEEISQAVQLYENP